MKSFRAAATAIFLTLSFNGLAAAQKADPALFGALPAIQDVEISPDGNTVAVIQNSGDDAFVVFFELNNPDTTPKGVNIGDVKARGLYWVDSNNILLLASVAHELGKFRFNSDRSELARWIAISKNDRELKMLFKRDIGYYVPSAGSVLATTPNSDGDAIFARWSGNARISGGGLGGRLTSRNDGTGYSLFNVNVESADADLTEPGNSDTYDWIIDENGNALMRIDYDSQTRERKFYRRRAGESRFNHVKTIKEEEGDWSSYSVYGIADDASHFYATTTLSNGRRSLVTVNANTMDVSRTVFNHDVYDIRSIIYDANIATAIGYRFTDDMPRTTYFDAELQEIQDNLAEALPGSSPMIVSRALNNRKMIILAINTDRPNEYYLFDRDTRNLAYFSSTYPALSDRVYATREKYNYHTDDLHLIRGYLTTPFGYEKQNLPLIVLPHGGPAARDDQSFDWWAAFYAARGYAVYQPNFRGSHGYGEIFREAGHGEWGRKMQDDVSDGVAKLIDEGIVDKDRVCIVGASYGGYAALAGATLTPDLYACAVSVNGVADLIAMLGEESRFSESVSEYWERLIGDRFDEMDAVRAVSPRHQAGYAKAPILLIHGRDDIVVPIAQSEMMRDAMENAGNAPVEFVELAGEDHWLSKAETRTEMLRRSIEFIDKHIGG